MSRSSGKPLSRNWLEAGRVLGRSIPCACPLFPGCPLAETGDSGGFTLVLNQWSLVIYESFSTNDIDSDIRDLSMKSCGTAATVHAGRWKKRKRFTQRAGKTATIISEVKSGGVVTCCVTLKILVSIQQS